MDTAHKQQAAKMASAAKVTAKPRVRNCSRIDAKTIGSPKGGALAEKLSLLERRYYIASTGWVANIQPETVETMTKLAANNGQIARSRKFLFNLASFPKYRPFPFPLVCEQYGGGIEIAMFIVPLP